VYIVLHVMVNLQRSFVGSFDALNENEIKLSESEAVAVLSVTPHPPPLHSLTTPTSVAFFKTGEN